MTAILRTSRKNEKYGWTFACSVAIHAVILLLVVFGGSLFPRSVINLGTGPGGGSNGESYSVGLTDELSGGAGMVKPSIVPQPPALVEKEPMVEKSSKAIPLPEKDPKKQKLSDKEKKLAEKAGAETNVIPTRPESGSGGSGGSAGGSGGGFGGGVGISIGTGSGGIGDNWYARTVEKRISEAWPLPPEGTRVHIVFSFYIAPDGSIGSVKLEKSCGNSLLDSAAERAVHSLSNPKLTPPPYELFHGRLVRFLAQFVYPPNE
jgi:outer membrane biosynthesis protein TonB